MIRKTCTALLLIAAIFAISASPAMAFSSYLTLFTTAFPSSTTATTASWSSSGARCNICHSAGAGTDINAFAVAWVMAGGNAAAFTAIRDLNSDGDAGGATNITEINAGAQPGWKPGPNNTLYDPFALTPTATRQNPPSSLIGPADPPTTPPSNRPPVLAAIGAKQAFENTALTFTATATDPDVGSVLTFSAGNLPTGATLNATTGAFRWTPSFTQGAQSYSVTVTVTDNGTPAQSDFEVVTITVGNVNRPPVLAAIGAKTVNENVPLSFIVSATDPDGDGMSFAMSGQPTGATLTDNLNGTATFSWSPNFSQGQTTPYSVTITVRDSAIPAATDFETFTITVGNVNRPPVLAPIGARTASVGQPITFTASATDPDGNALTFAGGTLPAGATLSPTTGAFAWTPTAAQVGSPSMTITVTDNGTPALNDSETFTITVGGVNRPPVLNPIGARTGSEGQLLTFTATATDPDGDALTFSATGLPSGARVTPAGVFRWTPAFTQAGTVNVTIAVTDGKAPAVSERFTITIGNVNQPPVLSPSPVGSRTVTEGQALTIAFTASDPDGGVLNFTTANLPIGAALTVTGPGTATFSWTPATGTAGTYQNVTVTVSDGALTDTEVFTITVNPPGTVNHAPTVTNPGNKTVTAGQPLAFTITGSDPDGDTLTFTATGLPSGASLSTAGAFRWTPTLAQASSTPYSVTVRATDNGSPALTSAAQTFTIKVNAPGVVNHAPTVTNPGNKRVTAGHLLAFTITGSDPDGNTLTFTATGLPSGASLSTGGAFRWTPTAAQASSTPYSVTVRATDNGSPALTSAAQTFTIRVVSVDLDIVWFRVSDEVEIGHDADESSVRIQLQVKNNGKLNLPRRATVVGMQGTTQVYRQTVSVSAAVGGVSTFTFPSYTPTTAGRITWTATVADDVAKAYTRVNNEEDD